MIRTQRKRIVAFPLQQYIGEHATRLRPTYIVYLLFLLTRYNITSYVHCLFVVLINTLQYYVQRALSVFILINTLQYYVLRIVCLLFLLTRYNITSNVRCLFFILINTLQYYVQRALSVFYSY